MLRSFKSWLESPTGQQRRNALAEDQSSEGRNETIAKAFRDALACCVCRATMTEPRTLIPCGHSACEMCLYEWFRRAPTEETLYEPWDRELIQSRKFCPTCNCRVWGRPVKSYQLRLAVDTLRTFHMDDLEEREEDEIAQLRPGQNIWDGIFPKDSSQFLLRGLMDSHDNLRNCVQCMGYIDEQTGICDNCGEAYECFNDEELGGDVMAPPDLPHEEPIALQRDETDAEMTASESELDDEEIPLEEAEEQINPENGSPDASELGQDDDAWNPVRTQGESLLYDTSENDVSGDSEDNADNFELQSHDSRGDQDTDGDTWVLPSWEPPMYDMPRHACGTTWRHEQLYRRGVTKAMLRRFALIYSHNKGIVVRYEGEFFRLGYNIHLAVDDKDGRKLVHNFQQNAIHGRHHIEKCGSEGARWRYEYVQKVKREEPVIWHGEELEERMQQPFIERDLAVEEEMRIKLSQERGINTLRQSPHPSSTSHAAPVPPDAPQVVSLGTLEGQREHFAQNEAAQQPGPAQQREVPPQGIQEHERQPLSSLDTRAPALSVDGAINRGDDAEEAQVAAGSSTGGPVPTRVIIVPPGNTPSHSVGDAQREDTSEAYATAQTSRSSRTTSIARSVAPPSAELAPRIKRERSTEDDMQSEPIRPTPPKRSRIEIEYTAEWVSAQQARSTAPAGETDITPQGTVPSSTRRHGGLTQAALGQPGPGPATIGARQRTAEVEGRTVTARKKSYRMTTGPFRRFKPTENTVPRAASEDGASPVRNSRKRLREEEAAEEPETHESVRPVKKRTGTRQTRKKRKASILTGPEMNDEGVPKPRYDLRERTEKQVKLPKEPTVDKPARARAKRRR